MELMINNSMESNMRIKIIKKMNRLWSMYCLKNQKIINNRRLNNDNRRSMNMKIE